MGYDMQVSGEVTLPKEKRADALAAILAEHDKDAFWSNPDFQFKRDRGQEVTFAEVFGEVVATEYMEEGPSNWLVEGEISFQGECRAGWGLDQVMHAIAPYATGGEVRWEGEDGERGRYYFAHGRVEEQYGTVLFGLSDELVNKLQTGVDRDTETMLEQSQEVGADA